MPSARVMEALLTEPPLTYNAARAKPVEDGTPVRYFCAICGYWGKVKCRKCGEQTENRFRELDIAADRILRYPGLQITTPNAGELQCLVEPGHYHHILARRQAAGVSLFGASRNSDCILT